jgi:hypothetical protein
LHAKLAELLAVAQREARMTRDDDPDLIARVVLDIYLSENRAWLATPQPQLARGIAGLRAALELALRAVLRA